MPHNYEQFEVVQVAFPRGSLVLARLKEEALRYTGRANAGPHILELLADRDAHLYGTAEGHGKGIWFPSNLLGPLVAPVRTVVTLPAKVEVTESSIVEESNAEDIDTQAANMATAFADDDDE